MKQFWIYLKLVILLLLVLTACNTHPVVTAATVMPTDVAGTPIPNDTSETGGNSGFVSAPATISSEVAARTPIPTMSPGFIEREINQVSSQTGLGDGTFLGLTAVDWINIFISILTFIIGYFVLTRLLIRILKRITQRTKMKFDDDFLNVVGSEIEKVVMIILLNFVIQRLDFISVTIKTYVSDILFVLGLIFIVIIFLKLVDFAADWYKKLLLAGKSKNSTKEEKDTDANVKTESDVNKKVGADKEKDNEQLDTVITLLRHASYIIIILTGNLVGLVHFGVEINIFTTILLIIGFGLVVGARTVLTDVIGGFIILVGQPFRVGDAIELEGWQSWGYVKDIGSRVIEVRTADNRKVLIPNSMAITGQVVNYSHPDTIFRVQSDIRISYHADLNRVRQLITDAVRGVDDVLLDEPIDVIFREFGNSARLLRVRWWILTYDAEFYMLDAVNSAIEEALIQAGIEIPFTTLDLSVNQGADTQAKSVTMQAPASSKQASRSP